MISLWIAEHLVLRVNISPDYEEKYGTNKTTFVADKCTLLVFFFNCGYQECD